MPRRNWKAQPRRENSGFAVKVLQLDISDSLLDAVRQIAEEKGVSIYRVIREFIQQGARDHFADRRIGERDEDTAPADVFAESREWQP